MTYGIFGVIFFFFSIYFKIGYRKDKDYLYVCKLVLNLTTYYLNNYQFSFTKKVILTVSYFFVGFINLVENIEFLFLVGLNNKNSFLSYLENNYSILFDVLQLIPLTFCLFFYL